MDLHFYLQILLSAGVIMMKNHNLLFALSNMFILDLQTYESDIIWRLDDFLGCGSRESCPKANWYFTNLQSQVSNVLLKTRDHGPDFKLNFSKQKLICTLLYTIKTMK